jgi:hypothetical protein
MPSGGALGIREILRDKREVSDMSSLRRLGLGVAAVAILVWGSSAHVMGQMEFSGNGDRLLVDQGAFAFTSSQGQTCTGAGVIALERGVIVIPMTACNESAALGNVGHLPALRFSASGFPGGLITGSLTDCTSGRCKQHHFRLTASTGGTPSSGGSPPNPPVRFGDLSATSVEPRQGALVESRGRFYTINIYDASGRLVYESFNRQSMRSSSLDRFLAHGVYLYVLSLRSADGKALHSEVRKLVIQR